MLLSHQRTMLGFYFDIFIILLPCLVSFKFKNNFLCVFLSISLEYKKKYPVNNFLEKKQRMKYDFKNHNLK